MGEKRLLFQILIFIIAEILINITSVNNSNSLLIIILPVPVLFHNPSSLLLIRSQFQPSLSALDFDRVIQSIEFLRRELY